MNPLNIEKLSIGSKKEPKLATIGDYWDEETVSKVTELLHEYQVLFPTKFLDMKGIIVDLGVMKITHNLDVKLVKQIPYRMNSKYKERVKVGLDKMIVAGIFEPVEELEWVSPMVVQ